MTQTSRHSTKQISLADLNVASVETCAALLEPLVERSPWLTDRIAAARPFATPADLSAAIEATILELDKVERLVLLRAHPELAMPHPEAMTAASQSEQGRLGLTAPSEGLRKSVEGMNTRYQARFGFPFVIALHRVSTLGAVLEAFEKRIMAEPEAEIATALSEVVSVSRARVATLVVHDMTSDMDHDPAGVAS